MQIINTFLLLLKIKGRYRYTGLRMQGPRFPFCPMIRMLLLTVKMVRSKKWKIILAALFFPKVRNFFQLEKMRHLS